MHTIHVYGRNFGDLFPGINPLHRASGESVPVVESRLMFFDACYCDARACMPNELGCFKYSFKPKQCVCVCVCERERERERERQVLSDSELFVT